MKTITIIFIILFSLSSCNKAPLTKVTTDNSNFKIEKLFTYDSITIYRFYDGGYSHYFAKNMVTSQITCGKHCTRIEKIETK